MKKFFEPVISAFSGITTHKLRSFLTVLGVVIGVGAVITLMAIGQGTQQRILSSIQGLGTNLLFIIPGSQTVGGVRSDAGSAASLTLKDAQAIQSDVYFVTSVAPYSTAGAQLVYGGQNMFSRVTGITPDYQQAYNLAIADGDAITEYQYETAQKVVVIGANVRTNLFGDIEPVGEKLRVGKIVMQVIGVLESKGQSIVGSVDNTVLIPLTTLRQGFSQQRNSRGEYIVSSITVSVNDQNNNAAAINEITDVLRQQHQLADSQDNDFTINSQQDIVNTISQATNSLTLLLGAIAGISLLVGGIGVMNIMLVSVIERTREIGIRKALGATNMDIWLQFLIEAACLTLTGGLFGIALGYIAAYFINQTGVITPVISPDIVILAVAVSVGIGLFFGFYPAWNASRLSPVEAFRTE
jgi:putative ABC transport system permease protein